MFSALALLLAIVVTDLLLSGDNAVVIALACRRLPPSQRNLGVGLGAAGALVARVVMSFVAAAAIARVPLLKAATGAYLCYVAVQMLSLDDGDEDDGEAPGALWRAVVVVTLADAAMSLDNVAALVALSHGSQVLMALGVALSIPLVVCGARVIAAVVDRLPLLVWAGAGLLGWVAGGLAAQDPLVLRYLGEDADNVWWALSIACAASVLFLGWARRAAGPDFDLMDDEAVRWQRDEWEP